MHEFAAYMVPFRVIDSHGDSWRTFHILIRSGSIDDTCSRRDGCGLGSSRAQDGAFKWVKNDTFSHLMTRILRDLKKPGKWRKLSHRLNEFWYLCSYTCSTTLNPIKWSMNGNTQRTFLHPAPNQVPTDSRIKLEGPWGWSIGRGWGPPWIFVMTHSGGYPSMIMVDFGLQTLDIYIINSCSN